MTDATYDADDSVTMWTCPPEILLLHLAECGVPIMDRKIWHCPCGGEGCVSAVGYGIGPAPVDANAAWTGKGAPPSHVLWIVPSTKFVPKTVPVFGLGPGETLAQMYGLMRDHDPNQAEWYGFMFEAGLREVLEAELATLGAS